MPPTPIPIAFDNQWGSTHIWPDLDLVCGRAVGRNRVIERSVERSKGHSQLRHCLLCCQHYYEGKLPHTHTHHHPVLRFSRNISSRIGHSHSQLLAPGPCRGSASAAAGARQSLQKVSRTPNANLLFCVFQNYRSRWCSTSTDTDTIRVILFISFLQGFEAGPRLITLFLAPFAFSDATDSDLPPLYLSYAPPNQWPRQTSSSISSQEGRSDFSSLVACVGSTPSGDLAAALVWIDLPGNALKGLVAPPNFICGSLPEWLCSHEARA